MKKILIAIDGIKDSREILSLFQNLLWIPENIVLLHVEQLEGNAMMTAMLGDAEMKTLKESLKGTEHKDKLDRKAEAILGYYSKELENGGLKNIRTVIKEGHHSDEILKTAEEEDVDLIVMNCSGKTRLHRLITGCASNEVEKCAKVPVLITKGDGCGKHAENWSRREAYAIR
jgi:nucleotide-binding universal stress UspA family protein